MKKSLIFMCLGMLWMIHPVQADGIVSVQQIQTAPVNYDGKEVKLRGIAKNATRLPMVDLKSYVLADGSGEITVLTESDLPRMNEEITIRAKVNILAIVKGEAMGLTVTELERYEQQQEL